MKNKAISSVKELEAIIKRCQFCNISMVDPDGKPYVIPMNYGYHENVFYFHGSRQGKKVDALRENPDVCISLSTDHELRYVNEEVACSWSMRYRSVIAYGKAEFIEDPEEKIKCLNIIMANYSNLEFQYSEPAVRDVMVFRVRVVKMDGRSYGY
jgi:nitroimidazol reductase NimA-like FMN-containing flavoprotein (pyridoxamine 5'-phosphate oxidase superfamily)